MFNTDRPICNVSEDKLGRGSFAKRLANSIMSFKTEETYAIALQGKWGCGKTSVLNMTIEEIEKANNRDTGEQDRIIIIRFNPWNFTDTTQLINQFFVTLSNSLKVEDKEKKFQILGGIIEDYSSALEYAEYIPVIGKYLKLLPEFGEKIGKAVRANAEGKVNDVAYQRSLVEQALRSLGKRILIVIDDIDRLPNEQIRFIFQLVNSVAGFPNTTYLLSFDKEIVVGALSAVQSGDGIAYLEKIIQFPFDMPPLNTRKLHDILFEKLASIIMLPDGIQFNSSRWESVFHACISPFIGTLRDVNRFCNILSFTYSAVKEEVDFIDMAGICALQVFAPSIFEWIKIHKNSLIDGYQGGGISLNKRKEQEKEMLQIFQDIYPNPDVMIQAIASLFPAFANTVSYLSCFQTTAELHQEMRIATASKFDLYFSLSLEDVKISRTEINASIFKMDEKELRNYIVLLSERDLLYDFIEEINYHLSRIPEERVGLIVTALLAQASSLIQRSRNGSMEINKGIFSVYTFSDFLFRVKDENARFELIAELFLTSDFPTFQYLIHLLHIIELTHGRIAETSNMHQKKLITLTDLQQLERIFMDRMQTFMKDIPVLDWEENYRALMLWEFINDASYSCYIKNIITDDLSAIKYLALSVVTWKSGSIVAEFELKKSYLKFISTEEAIKKIEQVRLTESFWDTGKDIPEYMAAFVLLEGEENSTVDADKVEEKIREWKGALTFGSSDE